MTDRTRVRLVALALPLLLAGCGGSGNPGAGGALESPRTASADEEQKIRTLIASLESGDVTGRAKAAGELGALGSVAKPAVPALAKAVESGDRALQLAAIRALGRIGPGASEAAPQLRAVASDPALGAEVERALEHVAP